MNRMLHYLMREPGKSAADAAPTDQQLLQRYLDSGNEDAFAELVRRHEQSVLKACRQVLRSAVDVDDAFQATFLVLLRRARQIRWQSSLKSWLVAVAHRIAVRLAISQQHRQQRDKNAIPAPSTSTPLAEVTWQEACAVLHEELNRLPDSFRLPLLLCYLQGYSRDEAAVLLGWKMGSVKAGLERGRTLLRQRLERRGVTLSAGLLTLLARPLVCEAASTASRSVQAITGTVSARVLSLSRDVGLAGWSMGTRAALCLLVLLLGTVSGLTWMWANSPVAATTAVASVPVASSTADDPESVTITGEVVDPQDNPVAGATIGVMKYTSIEHDRLHPPKLEPGTTTDASGKFQLIVNHPEFHVIAQKAGYGLDLDIITQQNHKQPIRFQLRKTMSIEGTVVDDQNKPVAGATVECQWLYRFVPGALEDKLQLIQAGADSNVLYSDPNRYVFLMNAGTFGWQAQTDQQGKFTIPGLPDGMQTTVRISKKQLATRQLDVILLPGFADQGTARHRLTASTVEEARLKANVQQSKITTEEARKRLRYYGMEFYSPRLNVFMSPSIVVEGTATNVRGEPVANLPVTISTNGTAMGRLEATTNAQGKYSVSEGSLGESYSVRSGDFGDYLPASGSAVHREKGPVRIDLKLRRGTILVGKVIDGTTGQGVRSSITIKPTPGNPLLNKAGVTLEHQVLSQQDGTFRIVSPPGDMLVSASADWNQEATQPMPYLPAKILESDSGLLQPINNPESRLVNFRGQTDYYDLGQAYQLMDLPEEKETRIELVLVRGKERPLKLLDPQGQPVPSALIYGLDSAGQVYEVNQANMTMVGIQPTEKPRHVFVINREKRLGGYAIAETATTEPLVIQLEPLATLKGRFIDGDSKPLARKRIDLATTLRTTWRYNSFSKIFPPVITDQDGRFAFTEIIPQVKYVFMATSSFEPSAGRPSWNKEYLLKAGEQLDLGNTTLRPETRRR